MSLHSREPIGHPFLAPPQKMGPHQRLHAAITKQPQSARSHLPRHATERTCRPFDLKCWLGSCIPILDGKWRFVQMHDQLLFVPTLRGATWW